VHLKEAGYFHQHAFKNMISQAKAQRINKYVNKWLSNNEYT